MITILGPSAEELPFLLAIRETGIDAARVFADWLEERGDTRGPQVRAVVDRAAVRTSYLQLKQIISWTWTGMPMVELAKAQCVTASMQVDPVWFTWWLRAWNKTKARCAITRSSQFEEARLVALRILLEEIAFGE
jgi:hypothetical protein